MTLRLRRRQVTDDELEARVQRALAYDAQAHLEAQAAAQAYAASGGRPAPLPGGGPPLVTWGGSSVLAGLFTCTACGRRFSVRRDLDAHPCQGAR